MSIFDLSDFKESLKTLANGGWVDTLYFGYFRDLSNDEIMDIGREGLKLVEDIEAHDGIVDSSMFWKWDDLYGTEFSTKMHRFRDWYTTRYGFVIPTQELIDGLSYWIRDKKVLSVLSGAGTIERALQKTGTNIIMTDDMSWVKGSKYNSRESAYSHWNVENIEDIDAVEAVKKYPDVDYILMSWPPYDSPIASEVLTAMREYNPKAKLIYFGTSDGGYCGDEDFFDNAEEIRDDGIDELLQYYVQFPGIHDTIMLFK